MYTLRQVFLWTIATRKRSAALLEQGAADARKEGSRKRQRQSHVIDSEEELESDVGLETVKDVLTFNIEEDEDDIVMEDEDISDSPASPASCEEDVDVVSAGDQSDTEVVAGRKKGLLRQLLDNEEVSVLHGKVPYLLLLLCL